MRRIFLKLYLLAAAISLTGCAATLPVETTPETFPAGNGFAAIRVVTNTAAVDASVGLNNRWLYLYVKDSSGKNYTLTWAISEGRRNSQVFKGFLPDGRYELSELDFLGVRQANLKKHGLTFNVKAGHITNLGTIVYQPTGNKGYALLRIDGNDDLRNAIHDEFPILCGNVTGPDLAFDGVQTGSNATLTNPTMIATGGSPLTNAVGSATLGVMQLISDRMSATEAIAAWANTKDPVTRLNMAKSNTFALNGIQRLPGGEILAASNLGQVLLRDPVRGWSRFNVGDVRELTAIHAKDRTQIVVGGEEGLLYSTKDGGVSWKRVPSPAGSALIANISEYKGETLVLCQSRNEYILSSTRDLEQGNWTELKRLRIQDYTALMMHASVQHIAAIVNNKYIVVTPWNAVHVLDLDTRDWSTVATAGWYRDVNAVAPQFLVASGGFTIAPHLSRDLGATWTEMKDSCAGIRSRVVSIAFIDPSKGYMLCAANGALVGSTSLKKTNDGGQSWSDVIKETPVMASQMFASKEYVIYVDILNRIHVSRDGGESWTLDRSAN